MKEIEKFYIISAITGIIILIFTVYPILNTFAWVKKDIMIESIVNIPMVMPHTVAGIALLTVLSKKSPIGKFFDSKGIEIVGTHFHYRGEIF